MSSSKKALYLTFDDGPIPEVTPWVLDTLKQYKAKATFFCVGDNVRKYPNIFERIITEGHGVGNHTFNHLDAWKTSKDKYLENVTKCHGVTQSLLFRPPYGRLKPSQAISLLKQYKIVMWDILSGDFDQTLSQEDCLDQVISNAQLGSIIVFHDSLKAEKTLRFVLPRALEHFQQEGYVFRKIEI